MMDGQTYTKGPGNSWRKKLAAWVRHEVEVHIPVAYEDEEGFHVGCKLPEFESSSVGSESVEVAAAH